MDISHITTVPELEDWLNANEETGIAKQSDKKELYEQLNEFLMRMKFSSLSRKEKITVKKFLRKLTGYSDRQIKRIIAKYKQGKLRWSGWNKDTSNPHKTYTQADIRLLHSVDEAHDWPSGTTTKAILEREWKIFQRSEFEQISQISVSHIYRVRRTKPYLFLGTKFEKTKNTPVAIGIRKKPSPNGEPGYLRVDCVHQGDKDRKKGVYYVNIVDEVTQFEFVFCVPAISEKYMRGVLEMLLKICPFKIINFHSDNGSEFINQVIAGLLNKAHISQTKSRARKSNDNALVESKNGSVVRKCFGYAHIPATEKNASLINSFCLSWLNPYLNYHHPCAFASIKVDKKGKEKKFYKQKDYKTPYEKLKSIPKWEHFLQSGTTPKLLDAIATQMSDTEFAIQMNQEKAKMFLKLKLF